MQRIFRKISQWVTVAVAMVLFFELCGCGGGYGTDSENAPQYQHSLFGTDTSDVQ